MAEVMSVNYIRANLVYQAGYLQKGPVAGDIMGREEDTVYFYTLVNFNAFN